MNNPNAPQTFAGLLRVFVDLIYTITPVLISLAFLAFGWGIVKFIASADNETQRAEGKRVMIWGLVALFVLMSYMGILAFFYGDIGFGIFQQTPLRLPE